MKAFESFYVNRHFLFSNSRKYPETLGKSFFYKWDWQGDFSFNLVWLSLMNMVNKQIVVLVHMINPLEIKRLQQKWPINKWLLFESEWIEEHVKMLDTLVFTRSVGTVRIYSIKHKKTRWSFQFILSVILYIWEISRRF